MPWRLTMLIDVKQANINTVSVEVQQLIVNNKKMTLSVFRQIPHQTLIGGRMHTTKAKKLSLFSDTEIDIEIVECDWNLKGKPWGLVNYFWGKQPTYYTHVVWQDNDILRRALEYHVPLGKVFHKDSDLDTCRYHLQNHPNDYIRQYTRSTDLRIKGNLTKDSLYKICEGYNAYVDYINKLPQLYIAV